MKSVPPPPPWPARRPAAGPAAAPRRRRGAWSGTWVPPRGSTDWPTVVGHVVGPLGAVPVAVLVLAARIGVPVGSRRLRLTHRCESVTVRPRGGTSPRSAGSVAGKSSRVCAPRVSARAWAARTMAVATSARLRTSHHSMASCSPAAEPTRPRAPAAWRRDRRRGGRPAPRSSPSGGGPATRPAVAPRSGSSDASGLDWAPASGAARPGITPGRRCRARERMAPVRLRPVLAPLDGLDARGGRRPCPRAGSCEASRLAPWTPVQVTSPAPQSPGSDEAPSRSVTMPPHV